MQDVPLSLPILDDGWEYTGEYRGPSKGEFFIGRGSKVTEAAVCLDSPRPIVKRTVVEPAALWIIFREDGSIYGYRKDYEAAKELLAEYEGTFCYDSFRIVRMVEHRE